MATKDERPTLLSKVAMFVRNPTKDWAELDRVDQEQEQDSGYDKQALKAMIERKRQNDFVRKREFDHLRKLRNRDVAALGGLARPSVFQSSLATDPDGRAVTLKKIDEIEAQMSKQWWKGKQDVGGAPKGSGFPIANKKSSSDAPTSQPGESSQDAPPTLGFERTVQADMLTALTQPNAADFQATEMGTPPPPRSPVQPAKVPIMGALAQSYDGSDAGFSTSKLFAIEVDEMATDPELEEAAIRFANGDDAGAESGLLTALRSHTIEPASALSWLAALLDLYRATNRPEKFAQAVVEFGMFLEKGAPMWAAIGEGLEASPAPAPVATKSSNPASGAIWTCPAVLSELDMEDLREALSSNPPPWHLDWAELEVIKVEAMPLLSGLFASLCAEEVALRFSGAERLVQALRSMMPSGNRTVGADWWLTRLNALRAMHLQDEFELAALDYCVTFEVAPPGWEDARCTYEVVAAPAESSTPTQPSAIVSQPGTLATAPMGLDAAPAVRLEIKGHVLGDAMQALAGLDRSGQDGDRIVVSCAQLVRVDFSAAGSILNWVAMRQSEGCLVQFRDVHRLVAAFFNVIGINEHARVVPRPI